MSRNRPDTFVVGGVSYDLTHTAGFVRQCVTKYAPNGLSVLCSFTHHCFTRDGATDNPNYTCEGESRNFCLDRYNDSLILPGLIVTYLDNCQAMKIYRTKDKNGAAKLMILNDPQLNQPYFVYFDLTRSNSKYADVKMTVASAFRKTRYKPQDYAKLGTELDRVIGSIPKLRNKKRPKK
ncbi:hypothetical protein [Hyphomonas adhaerens]|uniref:hypothetical protein n=1 Tax=Hyphomonas adhaerens TaxID=81029 RepID=UPI002353E566|nr:hypothetical protein [Hyphomonas adhaerens]